MTFPHLLSLLSLTLSALVTTSCALPASAGRVAPSSTARPFLSKEVAEEPLDPAFFARKEVELRAPLAFSLMTASIHGVEDIEATSRQVRSTFLGAVKANPGLIGRLGQFPNLTWEQRLPILREVFDLECQSLRMTPPELLISTQAIKGPAFFEFDPGQGGTGRVILNPDAIARDPNPWTALLLLIHETRHSAQFQFAFGPGSSSGRPFDAILPPSVERRAYREAFLAQKAMARDLNFCDFCSLNNEYEAFRFSNFVVGSLTGWKVDTLDMGCFSSQFDAHGLPRIDLLEIAGRVGPDSVFNMFNHLEREQYRLLKRS